MKIKKYRPNILKYFLIFLFFSVALIYSTIALHELVHKYDFKDIEKDWDDVCVLYKCDDGALGHYQAKFSNPEDRDKINHIKSYSEYNAQSISMIYLMTAYNLLFLLFMIIMKREVKLECKQVKHQ